MSLEDHERLAVLGTGLGNLTHILTQLTYATGGRDVTKHAGAAINAELEERIVRLWQMLNAALLGYAAVCRNDDDGTEYARRVLEDLA